MPKDRYGGSEEDWQAYYAELTSQATTSWDQDPVAQQCEYRYFVSNTYGKGRMRPRSKEVELFRYKPGRWRKLTGRNARVDEVAKEVLGDTVPGDEQIEEFLIRLRKL